tara:strand:- start:7 stop:1644 length:1638 start_codon:yes stop_codon:yes gene_type:complete
MAETSGLSSLPSRRGRLRGGDPTKIERDRAKALADVAGNKDMSALDKAALTTAFLPVVGDGIGLAADARHLYKDPSFANLGLMLAGIIPFVPSGGVTKVLKAGLSPKKVVEEAKSSLKSGLSEAMPQIPNYLRNFYSGNPLAKAYGVAEGGVKGLSNIIQARTFPQDRAILKEFGVPVSQTKTAKEAVKEYKKGKELLKTASSEESKEIRKTISQAMKKVTGQSRQTTLMGEQFSKPPAFNNITRGLDEVEFGNFDTKSYNKIIGGRKTGLTSKDFNSIFEDITKAWKVNPKKNYQMNVRRTNTQAAGNLDNFAYKRPIYGGASLTDLKKIFDGKKFKSGKEFLSALKSNNVNVKNPKEVLEGRPAIVVGNVSSDAIELGGVRYTTAIKRDGNLVSIMSDEHDLFFLKLPSADRMISVSTPINIDILKTKEKSQRLSKPVRESKEALGEARRVKAGIAEEELAKFPGVDTSLPTPTGSTKSQWYAVQALANLKPTHPDYSRLQKEVGIFAPSRAVKPVMREEEEKKKSGGSVMMRNPYDYNPRGI